MKLQRHNAIRELVTTTLVANQDELRRKLRRRGFEVTQATLAGLAHARENGKRLGRPLTAALHADQIRQLHRTGLSKSQIARQLNIGRTSVRRILATPPRKK